MGLRGRVFGVLSISLLMIWMGLASLIPEEIRRASPWIPDTGVQLGLDLQGGVHWLLGVDHRQVIQTRLQSIAEAAGLARTKARWKVAGGQIEVCGAAVEPLDALEGDARLERADGREGCTSFALRAREETRELGRATDAAMEVIRQRVKTLHEPVIQRQGVDRILVQLPGKDIDPARARDIFRPTLLEFKPVLAAAASKEGLQKQFPEGLPPDTVEVASAGHDEVLLVPREPLIRGDALDDAKIAFERVGRPVVTFSWNSAGTEIFRSFTRDNVGKRLAAIIDGVVVTAPVIQSEIGRSGQIEGHFSVQQATDLATRLRSGALPFEVHVEEERSIGPSLGADAIHSGMLSTLFAGLGVLALTALYYGRWGLLADLTLVLNLLIVLAFMGGFGATLTLPGIAGLALTIGMAVDSNIIIFERIREEMRAGRSLAKAVELGFSRSFLTIVDANLTTLIAAAVLYWIGRGPVQGFGVTLAVGIGATLFCAITVTRLLMELSVGRKRVAPEPVKALIPATTNIDFVGHMGVCSAISAALVALSIAGWAIFGFNLGIDFRGGTQLQISVPAQAGPTDEARVRAAFAGSRFDDAEVTRIDRAGAGEFVVRTAIAAPPSQSAAPGHTLGNEIQELLTAKLGSPVVFHSIESIGPRMGEEIGRSAILAIAVTTALILAYVWVRFDRVYAPGAVLALLHDVILAMGFFVWFGIEVDQNIVAALLVILGYSINDTVVIYDRIRENAAGGAARISDVVNASLNQTLSRTLLTSGFTLSSVIALLVFGGPVLRGLSLALLVGMVAGVYSTVYVASAILIGLDRRRGGGRPWLTSGQSPSAPSPG